MNINYVYVIYILMYLQGAVRIKIDWIRFAMFCKNPGQSKVKFYTQIQNFRFSSSLYLFTLSCEILKLPRQDVESRRPCWQRVKTQHVFKNIPKLDTQFITFFCPALQDRDVKCRQHCFCSRHMVPR